MSSLTFAAPLPGLEAAEGFSLRGIPGATGLFALEAEDPQVRMFVADASIYVPDYSPVIPRFALEAVGVSASEGTVLVVVNPASDQTTVNLMAPIVLNPATGVCMQVILDGGKYPLRAELAS